MAQTWLKYQEVVTGRRCGRPEKETAMTTYILVIGAGLYLGVAAVFYLFLLATAKPESQRG
jgi:hypothetical protein